MSTNPSRRIFLSQMGKSMLSLSVGAGGIASCGASSEKSDIITPYQFGASGDGRADDTMALQRALTAAIDQKRTLNLSHGKFRVTGSIVGRGNIRIVNSGGAVIEAASGRYEKSGVIVLEGRARRVGGLLAPARKGTNVLSLSPTLEFESGDIGAIYNANDFSYSEFRSYYRSGEFFEVDTTAGGALRTKQSLCDDYHQATVDIYKIHPIQGYIRDLAIKSDGVTESLLFIDYSRGFEIINPVLTNANNDCIVVNRSIRCLVRNPRLINYGDGGADYGLTWSNSQNCRAIGGEIYARRHAVSIGGADQVNSVPSRDVVIDSVTLRNDPATNVPCADIHGNSEQCGYERCLIFGGFSPQGKGSFLRGSTVHSMKIGAVVHAAELLGGVHIIEGNNFKISNDPAKTSRGVIDFGGNSDAITESTKADLTISVRNNVVNSTALGPSTMMLYVRNAGTNQKINVRFQGNKLNVNNFHSAVRMRTDAGLARSDFIEVGCDQIQTVGKYGLYPEKGYYDLKSARDATDIMCR